MTHLLSFWQWAENKLEHWGSGVGVILWGVLRGLRWVAALFLACFAVLVIAAVVPLSHSVYSVTLAAADVNTNVWLQLFTKEDPWLCLLCDIFDDDLSLTTTVFGALCETCYVFLGRPLPDKYRNTNQILIYN